MYLQLLAEGFLLGLALGTSCLATCAPVYLPVLMHRQRSFRSGLKAVFSLTAGRFVSYLTFGVIAGYIGKEFFASSSIMVFAYLLVGLYLIYTGVQSGKAEKHHCAVAKAGKYAGNPFVVGILTGISICPSFLGALTLAANAGGPAGGGMLFLGFFFGSSLYVLPFSFLAHFTKKRLFRIAGIAASLVIGLWFLFLAADTAFSLRDRISFYLEQAYVLSYIETPATIISSEPLSSSRLFPRAALIITPSHQVAQILEKLDDEAPVILLLQKQPDPELRQIVEKKRLQAVYTDIPGISLGAVHAYLNTYTFKARHHAGFLFRLPLQASGEENPDAK